MPEVLLKYKKPKTLKMIKALAEYLDFEIFTVKEKKVKINGITIIPADKSVDTSEMEALFSGRNLDAKELRQKAWQRTK